MLSSTIPTRSVLSVVVESEGPCYRTSRNIMRTEGDSLVTHALGRGGKGACLPDCRSSWRGSSLHTSTSHFPHPYLLLRASAMWLLVHPPVPTAGREAPSARLIHLFSFCLTNSLQPLAGPLPKSSPHEDKLFFQNS